MELLEHSCKPLKIVELPAYEPVESVANPLGHAGMPGSNNGQTASHGFRDGQAEGIFAAGADVEISGRIEIENILAGRFKTTALRNAQRFCHFVENVRRIAAGGDKENWQFSKSAHGVKNGFEPFDAPIVSDQKQHEISFPNLPAQPRIRARRKPRRRRKLRCIDAIGNDADILAVKITIEEPRGALGNGDDGNFRIGVDAALQLSKKSVVNAPMEPPKTVRPCQIDEFFTRKLLEAMEKRLNDANFGAQTVNSGRKDEIEPKPLAPAIPCAADGIQ